MEVHGCNMVMTHPVTSRCKTSMCIVLSHKWGTDSAKQCPCGDLEVYSTSGSGVGPGQVGVGPEQVQSWSGAVQSGSIVGQSICTKAYKLLGLIYHRFYNHAESPALLQLYLSLVSPHLQYATDVWDPQLQRDRLLIEDVQNLN